MWFDPVKNYIFNLAHLVNVASEITRYQLISGKVFLNTSKISVLWAAFLQLLQRAEAIGCTGQNKNVDQFCSLNFKCEAFIPTGFEIGGRQESKINIQTNKYF